jgi:two-component system chemotaxis sensor kinase CheA
MEAAAAAEGRKVRDDRQTLLIFSAGQDTRIAIPLSLVARLEEFSRAAVEHSAGRPVIRYRGQILPLIKVSEHLPLVPPGSEEESNSMQVVVYSENGRSVGLIVGKILDIVTENITAKRHAFGNGILGSVVIQDRVTDLLDVHSIIRASDPSFPIGGSVPSAA